MYACASVATSLLNRAPPQQKRGVFRASSTTRFLSSRKNSGTASGEHDVTAFRLWRAQAAENEIPAAQETKSEKAKDVSEEPRKSGVGFGAPKKKSRSTTIRRASPAQPLIVAPPDRQAQQIETAIVLTLASLGILIVVEGIALAASGFLPEEWDGFLSKILYPSFTPTIVVFVLGGTGYGLFKYLGSGTKRR